MLLFLYIIGIGIYCVLPLPIQIPLLLLNTMLPDPIPYIDEIIMYGSTVKKLVRLGNTLQWISEHKALTVAIIVGICILIKIIFF